MYRCGLPFKNCGERIDSHPPFLTTLSRLEEKYDIVLGTTAEDEEQTPLDQPVVRIVVR